MARRTAGRDNDGRWLLPRDPRSRLESDRDAASKDLSNLSSHLARGETEPHEEERVSCLAWSANARWKTFGLVFDASLDEDELARLLLPESRECRCVDASPSSVPLPPLLPPLPREEWRPRSSRDDDSSRDGEASPAPLCRGGRGVVAEVAEPRLELLFVEELPSCRCPGECGLVPLDPLEPDERSELRLGEVPPPREARFRVGEEERSGSIMALAPEFATRQISPSDASPSDATPSDRACI